MFLGSETVNDSGSITTRVFDALALCCKKIVIAAGNVIDR
jgi:hypothetical protein